MTFLLRFSVINACLIGFVFAAEHAHHEQQHQHAHEYHQQGKHIHGTGQLNFLLAGKEIQIELLTPAANIVGFEHAPATKAEHDAMAEAKEKLENAADLFNLNKKAQCEFAQADIDLNLEQDKTHNDISALYEFHCEKPALLKGVSVALFHEFSLLEKLDVQYVINARQGADTLTRDANELFWQE